MKAAWSPRAQGWPHWQHSKLVEAGGLSWHVQVWGTGPTALLVHGTGASTHSYREVLPRLAERCTVVAVDLPGHGFSGPAPFSPTPENVAGGLGALLAALSLGPVEVAVGHSAGAAVLARLAADGGLSPRLLVGLAPSLHPMPAFSRTVFSPLARWLSSHRLAAEVIALQSRRRRGVEDMVWGIGSRLDEQGLRLYQRLSTHADHVAGVLRMLAAWDLSSLWRLLPALPVPVLLLAGAQDRAIPLRELRRVQGHLARANLEIVSRAGHLLHEEQPAWVTSRLLGALG